MGNLSLILEVLNQHNHLSTALIQQNTCVYLFLSSFSASRVEKTSKPQKIPLKLAAMHEYIWTEMNSEMDISIP